MKSTKSKNTNSKEQKNQNKEFIIALIIVIIIVSVFVSTIFLPDIIADLKYKASLVDLVASDTYITDENGNKYYALNRSVEAINTDGVYGLLDDDEYCFIDFMKKEGEAPDYIVEYRGKIKGTVLRLESAAEITLADFQPVSADILTLVKFSLFTELDFLLIL